MMHYADLNRAVAAHGSSDAWARVLSRLGDYTAIIVRALNMRPERAAWLAQTHEHVLVQLSTATQHYVLRIAPEASLRHVVFFARHMEARSLPAARLIQADLRRTLVPFDYVLEGYVCGQPADTLRVPYQMRAVARQVGRTLRRMHRLHTPGWGAPSLNGRWLVPDWLSVLAELHARRAPESLALPVFRTDEQAAVAALLTQPVLSCAQPVLLHGAPGPGAVHCTMGEHVQIEALVNPGAVISGDGLLDLALALDPAYPGDWCTGVYEGYLAVAPLTPAEHARLERLRLLTCYWATCQRYARAEPHTATQEMTRILLAEHAPRPADDAHGLPAQEAER